MFAEAVRLEPQTVEKVKAMKPGERFLIDRNGDGRHEEAWFIDTAARHTDEVKPILVRAIDEDGDLDVDLGPDLDSDLYVVDWRADGEVDVVLDYQDDDGDGDVDQMAFYFHMPEHSYFGKDVLRVWWGRDDGDDNLLWYDVNYTYYQDRCQYRCHFSGDESFVAFGLMEGGERWASAFENPFLFYDPDGDRCSEVVLRIEGRDDRVRAIRYSFDADDDAHGRRTHDYDFSVTAIAPEGKEVPLPPESVESTTLRGIATQGWLRRDAARGFVERTAWDRAVLTWDEMNANTERNVEGDPNERWEGIIAHPSEHFPQVGGPPTSPLNKRNEVSLKPAAPMRLYYDPADRRLHLKGANEGWLHVDYNFDAKIDAKYTYLDENHDGVFERRRLDLDADGTPEFDWPMGGESIEDVALEFEAVRSAYRPRLEATLEESQRFIDTTLSATIGTHPQIRVSLRAGGGVMPLEIVCRHLSDSRWPEPFHAAADVMRFYAEDLDDWMPAAGLGRRIRSTPAGARLYVDLVRDRLFGGLKVLHGMQASWTQIESLYGRSEFDAAAELIRRELGDANADGAGRFVVASHPMKVPIRIENAGGSALENRPVTVLVTEVLAQAKDFNVGNFIVAGPERWLDVRELPRQIDTGETPVPHLPGEAEGGYTISFLADVPANGSATYALCYSPRGGNLRSQVRRTATAEDWVPPNIGWESNRAAYRAYWGQFDFFGKKVDRLLYPDIGAQSYHQETAWGIDALLVGKTAGLGGLTLYLGDQAYPVQNPAGEGNVQFTKRVVTTGPLRSAVEMTAKNIVPEKPELTVRLRCQIFAEHDETEVVATVTGTDQSVLLAPGFIRLKRERVFGDRERGCFGAWGFQDELIGDIGMGLIVSPERVVDVVELDEERRVRCSLDERGELRYWLIGDWRRGRQHPAAPTIDNWRTELRELAAQLLSDVKVTVGPVEPMP